MREWVGREAGIGWGVGRGEGGRGGGGNTSNSNALRRVYIRPLKKKKKEALSLTKKGLFIQICLHTRELKIRPASPPFLLPRQNGRH